MQNLIRAIMPPSFARLEQDLVQALTFVASFLGLTNGRKKDYTKSGFNAPDSLIVISSFPPKSGEPARLNAVACYTGNLLQAFRDRKIIVLCEVIDRPEIYRQGNLLIVRCFRRGSPSLYLDLFKTLGKFREPRQVLLQFEFNMFGQTSVTSLLPAFLVAVKLLGKPLTVVLHQVVDDLGTIAGHLGLRNKPLKRTTLNLGLKVFYILMGALSDTIIVHEAALKDRLARLVPKTKIEVISHGLSLEEKPESQTTAKARLGIKKDQFVLLLFGYLTWYKGVDWLIEKVGELAIKRPDLRLKLLVAGGPSATLKDKPHYQMFLRKVESLAAKYPRTVNLTGYIPEDKVRDYYSAADLVVLPYRALMSASGPLSFALRFAKPFLTSSALKDTFQNEDIKDILSQQKIKAAELMFSLTNHDFENKLEALIQEKGRLSRLQGVVLRLRSLRSWEDTVVAYQSVLARQQQPSVITQLVQGLTKLVTKPNTLIAARRE